MNGNVPRTATDRQEFYMRLAARLAFKSDMVERHGCVIVGGDGSIWATGFNHTSVHIRHCHSVHAEIDALCKLKRVDLANADMYVVRLGPASLGHRLKLSKPCESCVTQINRSAVKRVFYSWSHVESDNVVVDRSRHNNSIR